MVKLLHFPLRVGSRAGGALAVFASSITTSIVDFQTQREGATEDDIGRVLSYFQAVRGEPLSSQTTKNVT